MATRRKGGRPLKDIDPKLVEALAATGAPVTDIAAELGCHTRTLARRFSHVLDAGYARTKNRLRQKQIAMALGGNATLLVHLGKALLGQNVDRHELTGPDGGPIETTDVTEVRHRLADRIARFARAN